MSEENKPIEIETEESIKELSHMRILMLMLVVSVLGSIFGFIYISSQFGLGVILGGLLSFGNYYWLKKSLKGLIDKAIIGEKPTFLAGRYILRYLSFGLILAIIYLTKTVSMVAVILGLASFAIAIVVEGIIRLFTTFNK